MITDTHTYTPRTYVHMYFPSQFLPYTKQTTEIIINFASQISNLEVNIPYGGKLWWGETLANWFISSIWWKKVWWINRSANTLLIISTNLDGFSLGITDDSPNLQTFPLTKVSLHTVAWENFLNSRNKLNNGRTY